MAYFRVLQIAANQLKTMAKSTEDSIRVNPCRKNNCIMLASRLMVLALNQWTPSVVGRKEIAMHMPVVESMNRK